MKIFVLLSLLFMLPFFRQKTSELYWCSEKCQSWSCWQSDDADFKRMAYFFRGRKEQGSSFLTFSHNFFISKREFSSRQYQYRCQCVKCERRRLWLRSIISTIRYFLTLFKLSSRTIDIFSSLCEKCDLLLFARKYRELNYLNQLELLLL